MMCAGLGNTVADIDVSGAKVFSKTLFSMVIPEVEQELEKEAERKSVVLFGIEVRAEASICAFVCLCVCFLHKHQFLSI